MKIIKYLSLVLVIVLTASCEKHEIQYDSTTAVGLAEFQLHYCNPVISGSANNIYRIEINDSLYGNKTAPLNTYNAVPNGGVGRFFTVAPGNVNVKLYLTAKLAPKGDSLVYDEDVTLTATKQNVFVHDFNLPPVVFDNGFPYSRNTTTTTDSTAWVKFYNFLYELPDSTNILRIQYQYLDLRTGLPVNIGPPVKFGETTGWQPVTIVKLPNQIVSAGYRQMTFNMRVVDADGNDLGKLKIMNTSGAFVDYTYTQTTSEAMYIGRRYHHTFAGFRAVKTPNSSVRYFTAL
jgi:hypothetical protein